MAITINGSGTVTGITAGGLPDGIITADELASGVGGKVLQVVSTTKTDTQSIAGTTDTDVLTASITPSSTSSKILIMLDLNISNVQTGTETAGRRYGYAKLYRDTTQIAMGDSSGSRTQVWFSSNTVDVSNDGHRMAQSSGSYLDSPSSTSSITYKVKCANYATDATVMINRTGPDSDGTFTHRGASTLTLMEIAG